MKSMNRPILEDLPNPFEVLRSGSQFLARYLEKRNEQRYQEFADAALEGGVFPENAEAMTSEDFLAMLRALELDIEGEKATVYGRLACSIATGKVTGHLKRHFIKALSELSYGQVDLLRHAWIAERYEVFPGTGGGDREPREFLGIDSASSINRLTFGRWALIEQKGLSPVGRQFVAVCFTSEELRPSAVGFRLWSKGIIHLVCNEIGTPACYAFHQRLSDVGHGKAIRILISAARYDVRRPLARGPVMVVLLTENPQFLTDDWSSVEEVFRGRALTVVATAGASTALPTVFNGFERIDASLDRVDEAVQTVLARFEAHGLRGHSDN